MKERVKLTGALIRALRDVQSGQVFQIFDSKGNSFAGVKGTSPRSYRRLQEEFLIEDVRGSAQGAYVTRVQQKLTKKGEAALKDPRP